MACSCRSSLQTSASILASNVVALTAHLNNHAEFLSKTVVYPSTNYPGRTQEGLLGQLLRKKLEPHVETWVEEGRDIQAELHTGDTEEALLSWAKDWSMERISTYAQEQDGNNYTVAEREMGIENVRTGLRRKLEESDSEDEDDDDDEEMEDAGVQVTSARRSSLGQVEFGLSEVKKDPNGHVRRIEDILRFATSGADLGPMRR
jgi:mediator of RNA polymerase II transcription subunit 8, fungi type